MIFDAKQNMTAERARDTPDVNRVDDVPEVKVAGGRGCETGNGKGSENSPQPSEVQNMIPFLCPYDPFPPIERALRDPNGLLAAGADLSPERLLDAYARGI